MEKKNILLTALAFGLAFLLGCSSLIPGAGNAGALGMLEDIQEKHGMTEGFVADEAKMNSYLNELSELKGKAGGTEGMVVEAELESAKAFKYLTQALHELNDVSVSDADCKGKKINDALEYAETAAKSGKKAKSIISSLGEDSSYLRENQEKAVESYVQKAEQIKAAINKIC